MVTRDRARLARRSLDCLAAQTWPDIELVVVDDGAEDYRPLLEEYRQRLSIRHVRLAEDPAARLGALRNRALDEATGELIAQWDDDDWFHPERIATQVRFLQERRLDVVTLRWALVHLDEPGFVDRPFRGDSVDGFAGSILHRRTPLRYENLARSEDTAFHYALARAGRAGLIDESSGHLYVRCYHGGNTWPRAHLEGRLRRTLRDRLQYLLARWVRRDVFTHRAFRLTPAEQETARLLLASSRALGLLAAG